MKYDEKTWVNPIGGLMALSDVFYTTSFSLIQSSSEYKYEYVSLIFQS